MSHRADLCGDCGSTIEHGVCCYCGEGKPKPTHYRGFRSGPHVVDREMLLRVATGPLANDAHGRVILARP